MLQLRTLTNTLHGTMNFLLGNKEALAAKHASMRPKETTMLTIDLVHNIVRFRSKCVAELISPQSLLLCRAKICSADSLDKPEGIAPAFGIRGEKVRAPGGQESKHVRPLRKPGK